MIIMKEIEEIDVLIRARYPFIYIVSSEEERVLKAISKTTKKQIYVWSCIAGFRPLEKRAETDDNSKDPLQALRFVNNWEEHPDGAIFVLFDFHVFLSEQNYDVIRFMRELYNSLKFLKKNIIIISPILQIPPELEKEISVVDFQLPKEKEIKKIYETAFKAFKDHKQLNEKERTSFIKSAKKHKESNVKMLKGLNVNEIENVLYKSMVQHKKFLPEIIVEEKKGIIRKTGILEYFRSEETAKSVGGNDILIKWINQRKNAFTNKAKKFGLPYPKGFLLLGVSGCGKSLCCKAIANIWGFPLLRLDMASIFEGIVGSSERNMKKALELAEAMSPCILWVDEIEKALSGLGSSNVSDGGTTSRVFGSFLTWFQENQSPVFVVGTANDISALPPELLRKGRFDEIFFIDLPNENERKEIFKIHIVKRKRKIENYDLEILINASKDFSGAEIENSIVSGLFDAYDENSELTTAHVLKNLQITVPLSSTMDKKITALRTWAKGRARPTTTKSLIKKYSPNETRGIEL